MNKGQRTIAGLLTVITAVACLASPTAVAFGPSCTFTDAEAYGAGDQPQSVAIGDLDGDLDLDLVVANEGGHNVSVLLNAGDGTFAADVTYGAGDDPKSVAMGDLDGDLDLDLAVANRSSGNISVLLNGCPSTCPADIDGSGDVDFGDVLSILSAWGNAGGPEDLDGSGTVDFGDVLVVLTSWGPCA